MRGCARAAAPLAIRLSAFHTCSPPGTAREFNSRPQVYEYLELVERKVKRVEAQPPVQQAAAAPALPPVGGCLAAVLAAASAAPQPRLDLQQALKEQVANPLGTFGFLAGTC